jgi:hypothetical protein
MAKDFQLIDNPQGYRTKPDETNTTARVLIDGSKNTIVNDAERVEIRKGYELDGDAATENSAIKSAFNWLTSTGVERPMRSWKDRLEFRYIDDNGDVQYQKLKDEFTGVDFSFASWWDATEVLDLLLMVNGTDKIWSWSGGVTNFWLSTLKTAISGDTGSQLSNLELTGATASNTDDFTLYWEINSPGGDYEVALYRDSGKGGAYLEASGS